LADSNETRNEEKATFTFTIHNPNDASVVFTHAALFIKDLKVRKIKAIQNAHYPAIDHKSHIAIALEDPLNVNPHVVPVKFLLTPKSKASFTLWFQTNAGKGENYIEFRGTLKLYSESRDSAERIWTFLPMDVVIAPDSADMHYKK
jgi:hypothetical protein